MTTAKSLLKNVLTMKPAEKFQIIDQLLSSLDQSDAKLDKLWAQEAEDRMRAFDQGRLKAVSLEKVLKKYK